VGELFYCRDCGKVYGGRLPVSGTQSFYYIGRECSDHGDGSLLDKYDDLDSIPPELAMYEISIFNQQEKLA
jgi:hypothetical protein